MLPSTICSLLCLVIAFIFLAFAFSWVIALAMDGIEFTQSVFGIFSLMKNVFVQNFWSFIGIFTAVSENQKAAFMCTNLLEFSYIPQTIAEYNSIIDECPNYLNVDGIYPYSVFSTFSEMKNNTKALVDIKYQLD